MEVCLQLSRGNLAPSREAPPSSDFFAIRGAGLAVFDTGGLKDAMLGPQGVLEGGDLFLLGVAEHLLKKLHDS